MSLVLAATRHPVASTWTVRDLAMMHTLATSRRREPWGCAQLANHLHLGKPVITRATNSMIKQGMVTRRKSHKDLRLVCIEITEQGRKVMAEIAAEAGVAI